MLCCNGSSKKDSSSRRRKDIKHNRLVWVHPVYDVQGLKNDENKFFKLFLMLVASCDKLHGKLKDILQRQIFNFPELMLFEIWY